MVSLSIGVDGVIPIERYEPEVQEVFAEVLSCPQCAAHTGLRLISEQDTALIRCPLGHEWTDPHITAPGIRVLWHHSAAGMAPVLRPPDALTPIALPKLDEDRALLPRPSDDECEAQPALWDWELDVHLHGDTPALVESLRIARSLANFAYYSDGGLFDSWCPELGGHALDAHMSIVALALAIYDCARRADQFKIGWLPLSEPLAALLPTSAEALRTVRPLGFDEHEGRLRITDTRRLDQADDRQWSAWCAMARRIIHSHLNVVDRRQPVVAHGRELPSPTPMLIERARQYWPDDTTWYGSR